MVTSDVAAVVCTKNSMPVIEECLRSLRHSGISQIIVVDASSTDGTRDIAEQLADLVLTDSGEGLANARNLGVAHVTRKLVLNMGSDNVIERIQLERMINYLLDKKYSGVSACTHIDGEDWISRGLNAWRAGRFTTGERSVIGTPTLFYSEQLKKYPYAAERRFSDDSELCERWRTVFGARFAISDAVVVEKGKTTWSELVTRCRMYGISDDEVYRAGCRSGWSVGRRCKSLLHPAREDFVTPVLRVGGVAALRAIPFLVTFAGMRYFFWAQQAMGTRLPRD